MGPRPAGPGVPAPEAAEAWKQARAACEGARTYAGELAVSGRLGGRRLPGLASARLGLALTAMGSIALEANVSGQAVFVLKGKTTGAKLLLLDGPRVVEAPAADLVDALIGTRITPEQLFLILTGCVSSDAAFSRAERRGNHLALTWGERRVAYLVQRDGAWHLWAADIDALQVDYRTVTGGIPRTVVLRSSANPADPVDLRLSVLEVELNRDLNASLFVLDARDAAPMSLEELRGIGTR